MALWLSKPLYEFLPYFYVVVGVLLVSAGAALSAGAWGTLCMMLGLGFILAGALLWWRRRVYRKLH